MLMRVGAGHSARLSIPRDTVVNIPGHGRDKINAAYAIGGPALAITTVKEYLGHQGQPPGRGQLRELPQAHRLARRHRLHRRLRRLEDQRRLQERRLHAAPEGGHPPPRRQAGARARRARARTSAARARATSTARAPPAEGAGRDQGPGDLARPPSCACPGSPGRRRRRSAPTCRARRCWGSSARCRWRAPPTSVCSSPPAACALPDGGRRPHRLRGREAPRGQALPGALAPQRGRPRPSDLALPDIGGQTSPSRLWRNELRH